MFVKINLLLAVVILMLACGIYGSYAAGTVSHPASQIEPGTFGVGNFVFPQNLNITNNFTVDAGIFYVDSNNDRVGIGTTGPNHTFTVLGDVNLNNTLYVNKSTGNVGIGTTAPNSTLHVVGIVNATQGFAYGLSAARPAAKEGVVWWNVSAGFHCPQWYNSTHWICNTGAATRADPV